ncbi:MAG: hypothetical protein AB7S26_17675 [Sandaracinaceae bacterium]
MDEPLEERAAPAVLPAAGGQPLAVGLAAGSVAVYGALSWAYSVDDAWIVARYARRIASGHGYTFVDGPPTDGVTGPLALVPDLAGEVLFSDPLRGAKVFGIGCAALAAGWAVARAARDGRSHAILTALWIAACPLLGVWAGAGLETGMATLAFTALAFGADARDGRLVGGAILALAWLRPECAIAAVAALLSLYAAPVRSRGWAVGLALLGLGSILAFRLGVFGALLPLSASAKPADLGEGVAYVGRGLLLLTSGLGALAVGLGARDPSRRASGMVIAAHLVAVALAGGDWMPGFRLLVVAVPAAGYLAAHAFASRLPSVHGFAWILASLSLPALSGAMAIVDARDAGERRDTVGAAIATDLRATATKVALVDVGYLGFTSELEVVDLGGVTDPAVARRPGGHLGKEIDPGWLAAQDVDAILLHATSEPRTSGDRITGLPGGAAVERRVASMGHVRAEFRVARTYRYSPTYWYVLLLRAGPPDPSPPDGEGGTLAP